MEEPQQSTQQAAGKSVPGFNSETDVPVTSVAEATFLDVLSNREKATKGGIARQNGFVVLVRGGSSLTALQALCVDKNRQSWNDCLTLRYRLQPEAAVGTLVMAALSDLQKISRGNPDLRGQPLPISDDPLWKSSLASSSALRWLDKLPEAPRGTLDFDRLREMGFFEILNDEKILPVGRRLVLFAELTGEQPPESTQWEAAMRQVFGNLPERVGMVFSGAPENLSWPTGDPHYAEITLEEAQTAAGTEGRAAYKYVEGGLYSDTPTAEDSLGVGSYASALARFVLHSNTVPPLAVGIQGPWGKGKSSFMKLLSSALIRNARINRDAAVELAGIQQNISQLKSSLESMEEAQRQTALLELESLRRSEARLWGQMQKSAEQEVLTVWFNAWRFQDSQQIWAGLSSVISDRLEGALPAWRAFLLRLRYAWKRRRAELFVAIILPLMVLAVVGAYLVLGNGAEMWQTLAEAAGSEKASPLGALLKIFLPASSLLVAAWYLTTRVLKVVQPVSERVLGYVRLPGYKDQMGFQHRVLSDLRFVKQYLDAVRPGCKVVIFIDDLDRCSEEKVMEILQAINLILAESEFFVFLGMDTAMIHRAIRIHYQKANREEQLPERFPEDYLRKIVQISFHLPRSSSEVRFGLVSRLFSAEARRNFQPAKEGRQKEAEAPTDNAPADTGALTYNLDSLMPIEPEMVEEVEDTAEELRAFHEYREYLKDNPRDIKRLVNIHRLVKILLQEPELSRSAERQRKLVRWMLFCMSWPDLVDDVLAGVLDQPDAPNCFDCLKDLQVFQHPAAGDALLQQFISAAADPLSAADIDDNFRRAAELSQMISDSPAPREPRTKGPRRPEEPRPEEPRPEEPRTTVPEPPQSAAPQKQAGGRKKKRG